MSFGAKNHLRYIYKGSHSYSFFNLKKKEQERSQGKLALISLCSPLNEIETTVEVCYVERGGCKYSLGQFLKHTPTETHTKGSLTAISIAMVQTLKCVSHA